MVQPFKQVVLALSLVSSSLLASPADWPQWRGPGRDGHSADTGLLKTWPSDGPKLLWKASGLGIGYSSLSVVGGKIYTMGDGKDRSHLIALDLKGNVLWKTPVGKTGGNYAGTRATPTVSDGLVFGLGQFGDLVCLDAGTGAEKWRHNLENDFGGSVGGWNYTESPLVDGKKLICAPGGKSGAVVALDRATGAEIWRSKKFTDRSEYSSIVAATIGGVKQYVHLTHKSLVGLDADSGDVLWRTDRRGETAVIPTPIVHEDHVYVTSGYGVGCNLFKVTRAGDKFTVDEVYSNKDMVNHHGGVVKVGDQLYGYSDSKGWICQDFLTGKVIWRERDKLGKGSIAYADGMLYLREEDGKGRVVLIEASPDGWREHGRFDQPFRSQQNSWSHPVVAGGKLYLRDMDVLLCYQVGQKS